MLCVFLGESSWLGLTLVNEFAQAFRSRVKGYVRENWGAPFILAFIALLIVAAVSLAIGSSSLADDVAVYAYFSLVVGVVLQLVCFLKYGEKEE
jgi:heme/copper-type cytochrome/quinol oxidase subunit 4